HAQLLPRDGDRGVLRGARGGDRPVGLAVPVRAGRHPELDRRLCRDRRGAPRPEYRRWGLLLRAPLRRTADRNERAKPRRRDLRPRAREQPDADHPGPDRPLRRGGPAGPLGLAGAQAPAGSVAEDDVSTIDATRRLPRRLDRDAGLVGIGLAALGVWLMLPPFGDDLRRATDEVVVVPIVCGILAIAAGIWSASRREAKVGWSAITVGVVGIVLGVAAAEASITSHEAVFVWSSLFAATLRWATPLIFAAMGGLFSAGRGVVNIALEGMMLAGAFFGIWGAVRFDSWAIGLLTAMLGGGALALLHAFFSIHLRADQIVSGTAINFLALGLTGYLYIDLYGEEGTPSNVSMIPDVHLGFLDGVYFVGPILP